MALVLIALLPLQQSCTFNADSTLADLQKITAVAETLVTSVQDNLCPAGSTASATVCIDQATYAKVETYLTDLQTATSKALAIDNGAAKLDASQIAEIAALYANAALQGVTLPPAVALYVAAADAVVQIVVAAIGAAAKPATSKPLTIHGVLGSTLAYPFKKLAQSVVLPVKIVYSTETHHAAKNANDKLADHIAKLHAHAAAVLR